MEDVATIGTLATVPGLEVEQRRQRRAIVVERAIGIVLDQQRARGARRGEQRAPARQRDELAGRVRDCLL
jgi:hypothetical protein